jgi:dUTP pyrophosphatase
MSRPPGRTRIKIRVVRLPHGHGLDLPAYLSAGSAGMDLVAAVERPITLRPGQRLLIPTGLRIALPAGFEGQVRPRSGLALKKGLTVLNAPGTIDSDYRGELGVILINLGGRPVRIRRGDRIAQLVVATVAAVTWTETGRLSASRRGSGGFGHTGG